MQLFDDGFDISELDRDLNDGARLCEITNAADGNHLYAVMEGYQSMEDFEAEVGLAMRRKHGQRVRYEMRDVTGMYRDDADM